MTTATLTLTFKGSKLPRRLRAEAGDAVARLLEKAANDLAEQLRSTESRTTTSNESTNYAVI